MRILIAALVITVLVVPFAFGEVYSNTVGLYKIDVLNGRNLVSMPFLPFSASLDDVIGDQLTGHIFNPNLSDNIERWNTTTLMYERAWYNETTGTWQDAGGGAPIFDFDPDEAYWINRVLSHPDTTITLLGEVSETDREMSVIEGRNMVAPSFPKAVALDVSGLIASGFTGHLFNPNLSDNIEWWDNPADQYRRVWYKIATSEWLNWDGTAATRNIEPGEGMWINVLDAHTAFTWVCPKPY